MKKIAFIILVNITMIGGCANDVPLGQHVAKLKAEQTYNPDASLENLALIPDGNGEKMDSAYQLYLGKKTESLSSNTSQVIKGFQ
ncbi:hypothetical protein KX909_001149 [Vibrio vulnificus]|nr:hypothetical protein [Vibrio vulnificus]